MELKSTNGLLLGALSPGDTFLYKQSCWILTDNVMEGMLFIVDIEDGTTKWVKEDLEVKRAYYRAVEFTPDDCLELMV